MCRLSCAVLLALTLVGRVAHATPILSDNEAEFLGSLAAPTSESFEDLPTSARNALPIASTAFTMTMSGLSSGGLQWRVTDDLRPSAGLVPTDGTRYVEAGGGFSSNGAAFAVTFAFFEPITSFGLNIFDFGDVGGFGTLSISTDLGDSFLIAENPPRLSNGTLLFFGLTSPLPFSTVKLSKTTTTDGIGIDEVYFAQTIAVPEPNTIWIFLIGLTGLLVLFAEGNRRSRAG